jgi:pimeloyl-ACP methyl ester carboxylesterase
MSSVAEPRIRFFTGSQGQRIAYAAAGSGPPLVMPAWWVSHVERDVASERFRRFFEVLAAHHTVVRYDRPGVGLSVRERSEWTLESEVSQLEALIEHLGFEHLALLGFSCGGPPAVAYAATHPGRVSKLVLVGSYANGAEITTPELQTAMVDFTRAGWGIGSKTLSDLMAPDLDREASRKLAAEQRASSSADVAARLLQMTFELDCRSQAEALSVPTLVLHRRGDGTITSDAGRALAALIPDADFRVVEGDAHLPWLGEQAPLLDPILEFLAEPGAAPSVPEPDDDACVWRREGDLWRLRFSGQEVRLAHRKGLEDLAILLSNPMREVSAAELRGGPVGTAPAPEHGSDEVLDESARRQYADRLRDLTAEIEEADANHDLGRLEALQEEQEALLEQLRAASGLGGRTRRLGDPAERARKAVSARIRDAIKHVQKVHPDLANHLESSITTGLTCVYRPDTAHLWLS